MRKVWLIISREYITRVRRRSFILATFLAPLGIALLMLIPALLTQYSSSDQQIAVLDQSGYFKTALPNDDELYFTRITGEIDEWKMIYEAQGYDGVVYIPKLDLDRPTGISYYSHVNMGFKTRYYIERKISSKLEKEKMLALGISRADQEKLKVNVDLNTVISSDDGEQKGQEILATALGGIMGFAIYMVLLIYGTMVMRGVIEEKTNRIVEVIIGSVKPFQMLLGKVVGIGAVGLTQFLLWGILITGVQFLLGLFINDPEVMYKTMGSMEGGMDPDSIEESAAQMREALESFNFLRLGAIFIFYFLGGYMLYGALFAAIGSAASDDADNIQSLTFPVTIPIIISIFIMFTVIEQPHSGLAYWSSIIPFSSPIVMPAVMAFKEPGWELLISMLVLILSCIGTIWLAARIYRTGILLYGKRITIKEIGRWLLYNR